MKIMSGKLTNFCLKPILQRILVEVSSRANPYNNWGCCQTLSPKVISMYFTFQNLFSTSVPQTFSCLGKGGLNQRKQSEKESTLPCCYKVPD